MKPTYWPSIAVCASVVLLALVYQNEPMFVSRRPIVHPTIRALAAAEATRLQNSTEQQDATAGYILRIVRCSSDNDEEIRHSMQKAEIGAIRQLYERGDQSAREGLIWAALHRVPGAPSLDEATKLLLESIDEDKPYALRFLPLLKLGNENPRNLPPRVLMYLGRKLSQGNAEAAYIAGELALADDATATADALVLLCRAADQGLALAEVKLAKLHQIGEYQSRTAQETEMLEAILKVLDHRNLDERSRALEAEKPRVLEHAMNSVFGAALGGDSSSLDVIALSLSVPEGPSETIWASGIGHITNDVGNASGSYVLATIEANRGNHTRAEQLLKEGAAKNAWRSVATVAVLEKKAGDIRDALGISRTMDLAGFLNMQIAETIQSKYSSPPEAVRIFLPVPSSFSARGTRGERLAYVSFLIDQQGRSRECVVQDATDATRRRLEKIVSRWVFKPARRDGQAITCPFAVPIYLN